MGGDDFQKGDPSERSLGKKIKLAKSKLQLSIDEAIEQIMSDGLSDYIVKTIEMGRKKGWRPITLIKGENYEGIAHDTLCSELIQHLDHEGVKAEISYSLGCPECWLVKGECGCYTEFRYPPLSDRERQFIETHPAALRPQFEMRKKYEWEGKYQSLTILNFEIR